MKVFLKFISISLLLFTPIFVWKIVISKTSIFDSIQKSTESISLLLVSLSIGITVYLLGKKFDHK
jgi:hypothetical protein